MSFDEHPPVNPYESAPSEEPRAAESTKESKQDASDHERSDHPASGEKDADKQQEEEKSPRSKKPLIIMGIIALVVGIVGFIVWFATRNQESTDDAYTDGNVVTMAPQVAGHVTGLFIDDNSRVAKGQLLVQIDLRDYATARDNAQAQLALAEAELAGARDALAIARVQYPAQLQSANAQRQSAAAALMQAQQSYDRQHSVDKRATTQENIDASTSQQLSADASLKTAAAQVSIARLVPQQIRQAESTVAQRQAAVAQARAQLDQALLNLSYTEIRAPVDGFVTLRSVQVGTYVTAGQSMFLLVTPDVWVTANYKESQIGRMRPGDKVDMKVDAYSGYALEGHVQSIQYGSGSRFSAFPAENATGNFVKIVQRVPVKIVIDRGLDPDRPLPIGLSVSPTVHFP